VECRIVDNTEVTLKPVNGPMWHVPTLGSGGALRALGGRDA